MQYLHLSLCQPSPIKQSTLATCCTGGAHPATYETCNNWRIARQQHNRCSQQQIRTTEGARLSHTDVLHFLHHMQRNLNHSCMHTTTSTWQDAPQHIHCQRQQTLQPRQGPEHTGDCSESPYTSASQVRRSPGSAAHNSRVVQVTKATALS